MFIYIRAMQKYSTLRTHILRHGVCNPSDLKVMLPAPSVNVNLATDAVSEADPTHDHEDWIRFLGTAQFKHSIPQNATVPCSFTSTVLYSALLFVVLQYRQKYTMYLGHATMTAKIPNSRDHGAV